MSLGINLISALYSNVYIYVSYDNSCIFVIFFIQYNNNNIIRRSILNFRGKDELTRK